MRDYNILDYRTERWKGFKDYYIKEMYSGDDPNCPALNYICDKFKLTEEQRYWIAFLYGTNYCVPTTYYIFMEFPDFENIDTEKLQLWWVKNKEKTYFQTDRAKVKNFDYFVRCVESYQDLVGKSQVKTFNNFFDIDDKQERYKEIYDFTNKIFYFGRFSLFNYLETVNNLTNLKMEPNGLDLKFAESARNGLCYVCNKDNFVTLHHKKPKEKINFRYLQEKLEKIIYELKQENPEIDINYWNVETVLCAYKKLFWNTRYLGYYIDRQMEDIIKMQNNVVHMNWEVLWEFRERFHHPQFLGEFNDWDGVREKNKYFVTAHGILDIKEFPKYKTYSSKVDLQSTKKPKLMSSLEYTKKRKIKKVESKKIWEYF